MSSHVVRAALVGAVIVAATVAPAATAAPPAVIQVVSITTSSSSVDVPPKKKANVGDHDTSTSRLLNVTAQFGRPKGAVVGSDRGTITLTSPGSALMKVVARFPGGTIVVRGPLSSLGNGAVSIPVVGGTAVFAGARGTLTILRPINPKTAINIYRLTYAPVA